MCCPGAADLGLLIAKRLIDAQVLADIERVAPRPGVTV